MPSAQPSPRSGPISLGNAAYFVACVVLPAFFIYGSHDLWNLPRWVLALAFLAIALPVAAFQRGNDIRLRLVPLLICLAWAAWTAVAALSVYNAGDAVYVLGIRMAGMGMALWFSMQKDVFRSVPFFVAFGLLEAAIGSGELLGFLSMNELMHVPIGTAGNNNVYGCMMALLLPFPLLWLQRSYGWQRWAAIAAACAIGSMVMVSTSRTAMLAVPLAALILALLRLLNKKTSLFLSRRARLWLILPIPMLLIAAPIAWAGANFETGQIPTEETTGITERGILWRESIDMVQDAPLLGCGPAGWKYEVLQRGLTGYSTEYGLRYFTRPHNDFLWVATETGIPAALCYIALLVFLFYFSVKRALFLNGRGTRNEYSILGAGVLVWIIVSGLNFPLERMDHLVIFAAYVALIFSEKSLDCKYKSQLKRSFALLGLVFAALFLFGAQRFLQDRHLQEIELARKAGQADKVLEECSKTASRLFTVDYYTSTPIAFYEGIALLQKGNAKAAMERLSEGYETNPWHPHLLNNLASIHILLGDEKQAERYYREAIGRFRDFPDPYINLSKVLVARGDNAGAIGLLKSFPAEAKSHQKAILKELEIIGP